MGAWGVAISANDTYADIYSQFFVLYDSGLEVEEISKRLIAENHEKINDAEDSNNFWFALAKAQWECKRLDKDILSLIRDIIETGSDIEAWRALDASEKDIKKRKAILEKFLGDLHVERPKAKARKKKINREPIYRKGDCLIFQLSNGNFGGAVVLEQVNNSKYGANLIVTTRINQPHKPVKEDFENAEVLIKNFANWTDALAVYWYLPIRHKYIAHLIGAIGTLEVKKKYELNNSNFGFIGDFDTHIIQVAEEQIKSEATKPRPKTKWTIKEFTKENKWKFW